MSIARSPWSWRLRRFAGAVLIVASALLTATEAMAADTQTAVPGSAFTLDRPLSGHLEAGSVGHFAYYRFIYPADGTTATINLQVWPDDPAVLKNAGFNLYGPQSDRLQVQGGAQPGLNPNISGNLIQADPNAAGTYIVQVYNWDPGAAIDFTLSATGLPPQPAPIPGTAVPPRGVLAGHLDAGSQIARHEFTYSGDGSVVGIAVQVTPDDESVLRYIGFQVYGPRPGKVYATGIAQAGLTPNVLGNLVTDEPGTYVVQIFNTHPRAPIDYRLTIAAPLPTPGDRTRNGPRP